MKVPDVICEPIFCQFNQKFSDELLEFIRVIHHEGFFLVMVGGAVRDYILTKELSSDFDFEIRHTNGYRGDEWEQQVLGLCQKLKKMYGYDLEMLPFLVFRIRFKEISLEISSPRIEYFDEVDQSGQGLSHSDFKVSISSDPGYKESFLRRDFTINSVGIDTNSFDVIDPLGGIADLKNGILKNCGDNFVKDPVRFLRMIRFGLKFGFDFDSEMRKMLSQFDLRKLTNFYFIKEIEKSDFFPFINLFFEMAKKYKIKLSQELEGLRFISEKKISLGNSIKVNSVDQALGLMVASGKFPREELDRFILFFQLKKKRLKHFLGMEKKSKKNKIFNYEKSCLSGDESFKKKILIDIKDIFFLSSSRKEFNGQKEKDEFFDRWAGIYIEEHPSSFYLCFDQENEKVLGYLCGATGELSKDNLSSVFQDMFGQFPAHFHINCHPAGRGMGIGQQLVERFCRHLIKKNICGVHIITSANEANVLFYRKNGFSTEMTRRHNDVELHFMGRKLNSK